MQTRNTIFTLKMPFVTIRSQGSESSGEAICRPCGVIIQASRRVSTTSAFSEKVISGSRNTQSPIKGGQHTQLVLCNSATVGLCTRHSISRIPSRRQPGGANGFSGCRIDAGLKVCDDLHRIGQLSWAARTGRPCFVCERIQSCAMTSYLETFCLTISYPTTQAHRA